MTDQTGQLVTSRKADDIPPFNRQITRLFDRFGRQHERHRYPDKPRRAV
jgi:hypothetical protein